MPVSLPPPAVLAKLFPANAPVTVPKRRFTFFAHPQGGSGNGLAYQEPTEIVVEAAEPEYDLVTGIYTFRNGVKATYGPTTLFADNLVVRQAAVAPEGSPPGTPPPVRPPVEVTLGGRTIQLETEQGYAFGNVRIVDPDGTVNADSLQFRWREDARSGIAENVSLQVGGTRITGARLVYTPEKTTLYDAFGTACRQSVPFLAARTAKIDIVPGQRASVQRPQLQILGQRLPALPFNIGFSLDPRTEGLRLPSLVFNRERGVFGIAAGGNRLIDPQTQVDFDFAAFPSNRPRYGAQYFHSTLPPDAPQGRLAVISDLDERFFYSWFTSVFSGEPNSEVSYLRQPRSSYGAVSTWNAGATGRVPGGQPYTKLLEGVVERGGPLGSGGFQTQLRASAFREGFGDFGPRVSLNGDYAQLLAQRGRVSTIGRVDASVVGGKGIFGYAGGEIGTWYTASPSIRFGASAFAYLQGGDSGYTLDRIRYPRGFSLRTDLNSAPTKFSLLLRFDERGRQFDREYRFSQVIGCLEPVIAYREYPRSYQIGFRFRLDDLTNILQRRDPKRRGGKPNPFER